MSRVEDKISLGWSHDLERRVAKDAEKDKGKKFDKFEVEMERLGKKYTVVCDVKDIRVGRGRRTIVSKGTFKDARNWIRVETNGADNYKDTIPRTFDCLDRRGFIPRAYRIWTGLKWGPWSDVAGYPKPRESTRTAAKGAKA